MILDWFNPTPGKFQRTQRPCAECQRYQHMIAIAYRGGDEAAEVKLRQEFQRHLAEVKHAV